jgi:hypothetical protein
MQSASGTIHLLVHTRHKFWFVCSQQFVEFTVELLFWNNESESSERPSGVRAAKQYSSGTQARLLAAEHKIHAMLLLCTWQKHTMAVMCEGWGWGVCLSVEMVWSVQILRCRIQTQPISWLQVGERRRWNSLAKLRRWAMLGLSDPWTRSRHSWGPITKTNNSAVSND